MSKEGKNGVSAKTPENIPFGAGTIHKGLKYTPGVDGKAGTWNFLESIVGATNGGSKLSIIPEVLEVPVDGALVAAKGLTVKNGETATMEVNFAELTEDIIKAAAIGMNGESEDATFNAIVSKASIDDSDYWENVAFVGKTLKGKNIIAILPDVLCISGFENASKNKEGAVGKYTFKCHAELTSDLDTLPWKIYYPKA